MAPPIDSRGVGYWHHVRCGPFSRLLCYKIGCVPKRSLVGVVSYLASRSMWVLKSSLSSRSWDIRRRAINSETVSTALTITGIGLSIALGLLVTLMLAVVAIVSAPRLWNRISSAKRNLRVLGSAGSSRDKALAAVVGVSMMLARQRTSEEVRQSRH